MIPGGDKKLTCSAPDFLFIPLCARRPLSLSLVFSLSLLPVARASMRSSRLQFFFLPLFFRCIVRASAQVYIPIQQDGYSARARCQKFGGFPISLMRAIPARVCCGTFMYETNKKPRVRYRQSTTRQNNKGAVRREICGNPLETISFATFDSVKEEEKKLTRVLCGE